MNVNNNNITPINSGTSPTDLPFTISQTGTDLPDSTTASVQVASSKGARALEIAKTTGRVIAGAAGIAGLVALAPLERTAMLIVATVGAPFGDFAFLSNVMDDKYMEAFSKVGFWMIGQKATESQPSFKVESQGGRHEPIKSGMKIEEKKEDEDEREEIPLNKKRQSQDNYSLDIEAPPQKVDKRMDKEKKVIKSEDMELEKSKIEPLEDDDINLADDKKK